MSNIIITGEIGVGKDYIVNKITKHFCVDRSVTDTTRPMREGEVDGVHYNFRSDSDFEKDVCIGRYLEIQEYDTVYGRWFYGSRISKIKPNSIIILDADGAEVYKKHFPFAIHIHLSVWDETERFYRSLKRLGDSCSMSDVEEVYRRLNKDKVKFKNMDDKTPFIVPQMYSDTTTELVFAILDSMGVERKKEVV